jgi:hypothetical protein
VDKLLRRVDVVGPVLDSQGHCVPEEEVMILPLLRTPHCIAIWRFRWNGARARSGRPGLIARWKTKTAGGGPAVIEAELVESV